MLFAIDIDGTIASVRGTNAYALYVNAVLGLSVSTEWTLVGDSSIEEQLLQDPQLAAWANSEKRVAELQSVLKDGQYHPIVQQHALPIVGAIEGVNALSELGDIFYITNRKPSTAALTQNWLELHGFPHADRLYCCGEEKGFVSKLQYAASILLAEPEHGPLIFIDDRAAMLEKSLQPLIKLDRDLVSRLLPHTAILA